MNKDDSSAAAARAAALPATEAFRAALADVWRRERYGPRQRQIVAAAGVSREAARQYTTGRRTPPIDLAIALGGAIGLSLEARRAGRRAIPLDATTMRAVLGDRVPTLDAVEEIARQLGYTLHWVGEAA